MRELRGAVGPAAVGLAAQRASAEGVVDMEAAFAAMVKAVDEGGDYVSADLRFHQGLLRAGHNRMLLQMGKALAALLRVSFEMSIANRNSRKLSLPLHRAILDAVIAKQPLKAERAVLRLIDGAQNDIDQVLARRTQPKGTRAARPAAP